MKKNLVIICVILMMPFVVLAGENETQTCANGSGTVIEGNDGTKFCKSNRVMNWWTALGWCQSIGKTMMRYPADCRCLGDGCPTIESKCPNLTGISNVTVWSSTPASRGYAFHVSLSNGNVDGQSCSYLTYGHYALCRYFSD